MEKSRGMYCLLFSFFIGGITLGSICGLGWKDAVIESDREFLHIFFKNLPLFLMVNFWGREEYALCLSLLGLFAKGVFLGTAAVALLISAPVSCVGIILPQLCLTVPAAVTLGCLNFRKKNKSCTKITILTKILQAVLVNFLVSCGEFGLYSYLPQNY